MRNELTIVILIVPLYGYLKKLDYLWMVLVNAAVKLTLCGRVYHYLLVKF